MAESARTIGIDLGTTNTCVAVVRNHVPRLVSTQAGNVMFPSVVSLMDSGQWLVGQRAKERQLLSPSSTISGSKRFIGLKSDAYWLDTLKKQFSYIIEPSSQGEVAFRIRDQVFSPIELSALVLAEAKRAAEQSLMQRVDSAVISVPAYFNERQRQLVKEAGSRAGLLVKRIVNEPTAAALAYGFHRGVEQRVLVYDLGGGTFDVSILQLSGNIYEVLATGGDPLLGGIDFDERIVSFWVERFNRELRVGLSSTPALMQRLRQAAEQAKVDLTLLSKVSIELPFAKTGDDKSLSLHAELSREQLNGLTCDLVDRTLEICDRVLEERGLLKSGIDEVLLVGGQSRMPLVQQRIQAHFGKAPRKGVHPDECVALGAALVADSLEQIDSVTLIDVLTHSIGVADENGKFQVVLKRHTSLPQSQPWALNGARQKENATRVLHVFQGEHALASKNTFLGTVELPAGIQGGHVDFSLSEEGLFEVRGQTASGPQTFPVVLTECPEYLRPTGTHALPPSGVLKSSPKDKIADSSQV